MPHNIPLMRRVLDHITSNPGQHNQSSYRECVAGWAVRLHGDWGFLNTTGPGAMAVDAVNFRTGRVADVDDLAAELLGITEDEAEYLFHEAFNRGAVAWLEDALASHDGKVLDWLEASLVDDDYPFGQVTA